MRKKNKFKVLSRGGRVIVPGFMASANAFLDNIGFVVIVNSLVDWDQKQWKVSPGILLKALILATFTEKRPPLYKIKWFYQSIDTELLFGEGVTAELLTDYAIGTALERLYDANLGKFFQIISLLVLQEYEIPINRLHSDTTSISFYGKYEEEEEEDSDTITIKHGHNKDNRPECKQMVLGQITNEAGIPILCKAMDGNTSDVTWNEEAIQMMNELKQKFEAEDAIYVADCKLMTKKHFLSMINKSIFFISRVPANFDKKLESRIREEAYAKGEWEEIGTISNKKKACTYSIQTFTKIVYGVPTRLLVVKSSSSLEAFLISQKKKKRLLENETKKLMKKVFSCKEDAQKEWNEFCKKHKNIPYHLSMELEEIKTEKRPVGRPGKNSKPPQIIIEWALKVEVQEDQVAKERLQQKAESFVLISNVPEELLKPVDILKYYKGQIVVELNFKVLKSPALVSTVFLENEDRIESMTVLLGVSLMIRSLILYQLRKGFEESGEHPRIGYSNTKLKTVTLGLFQYAMEAVIIERQQDETYHIIIGEEQQLRVITLLQYLNMDPPDLVTE